MLRTSSAAEAGVSEFIIKETAKSNDAVNNNMWTRTDKKKKMDLNKAEIEHTATHPTSGAIN